MSFDISQFLQAYTVDGFYCFDASKVLKDFPIEAFMPFKRGDYNYKTSDPDERFQYYNAEQVKLIKQLSRNISDEYFKDLNHCIYFNDMWNGTDPSSVIWHNDLMRCWKGFNSSFNCYFDQSGPEIGGRFESHPFEEELPESAVPIAGHYPDKYSILIINQNSNFLHRVSKCDVQRRMFTYACGFYDINPVAWGCSE